MDLKNYNITVGEVLKNPQAKAMLQKELPMIMRHPMLPMANAIPLPGISSITQVVMFPPERCSPFWKNSRKFREKKKNFKKN